METQMTDTPTILTLWPGPTSGGDSGALAQLRYGIDTLDVRTLNLVPPNGAALRTSDFAVFVAAGVPDVSAQAELAVNPAGADNTVTFTAVAFGAGGDAISVEYVDPGVEDATIAVTVDGNAITVSLGTDSAAGITSTAGEVVTAVEASADAMELVTVASSPDTGIVTAMAVANLADGTGYGVGTAPTGSLYIDITNAKIYINGGDEVEPTWNIVTSA
jgi:hypothetical protein